jgi:hypothetical protein
MAVYPIRRKMPSEVGAFITIDEAQTEGSVIIREKGKGSVPVVVIINRSRLPIYIPAGEVIVGGKQDRMVAYDVIIYPGRELDIEVKCVEGGRWQDGNKNFRATGEIGSRKTKSAVQLEDQDELWSQVAKLNTACKVTPSSGTYLASATSEDIRRRYDEYARAFLPSLDGRDIVGFAVAVDGEILAIEIFGSPRIFFKMKAKLLKSYVYDTIGVEDKRAPAPGREAMLSFYRNVMRENQEAMKEYENNRNMKRENNDASQTQCLDAENRSIRNSLIRK